MLPGIDGFDICRLLKNKDLTRNIPILILSAKGEESDIIKGLELGQMIVQSHLCKSFIS